VNECVDMPATRRKPRPPILANDISSMSAADTSSVEPPRAAYIHVPFCRHRCGYCDFTLIAGRDDLREAYLDALKRELDMAFVQPPRSPSSVGEGRGEGAFSNVAEP
jgi:coproporphyrinogen III oxidase-like Fe-S oxidoreductase